MKLAFGMLTILAIIAATTIVWCGWSVSDGSASGGLVVIQQDRAQPAQGTYVEVPPSPEGDVALAEAVVVPQVEVANSTDTARDVIRRILGRLSRLDLTNLQVDEVLTVNGVLGNVALNPWGYSLSSDDSKTLQQALAVFSMQLQAAESHRSTVANSVMDTLVEEGRYEVLTLKISEIKPTHAEEEVRMRRVGNGPRRVFRIQWGDSAEYDDIRGRIGGIKEQYVEMVVLFLFEHGR